MAKLSTQHTVAGISIKIVTLNDLLHDLCEYEQGILYTAYKLGKACDVFVFAAHLNPIFSFAYTCKLRFPITD